VNSATAVEKKHMQALQQPVVDDGTSVSDTSLVKKNIKHYVKKKVLSKREHCMSS